MDKKLPDIFAQVAIITDQVGDAAAGIIAATQQFNMKTPDGAGANIGIGNNQVDTLKKAAVKAIIPVDKLKTELLGIERVLRNFEIAQMNKEVADIEIPPDVLTNFQNINKQIETAVETIKKLSDADRDASSDMIGNLLKRQKEFAAISKELKSQHKQIDAISKALSTIGAKGMSDFISNLKTTEGKLSNVAVILGPLKRAIISLNEQGAKFLTQNYVGYGNAVEIANNAVRAAGKYSIMQDKAMEATLALANTGIPRQADSMADLIGIVGEYERMTGVSAETTAGFVRVLGIMGKSDSEIKMRLGRMANSMATFRFNAAESGKVMGVFTNTAFMMSGRLNPQQLDKYSQSIMNIAGVAKAATGEIDSMMNVLNNLTNDAEQFAYSLGPAGLFAENPAEQFSILMQNADQMSAQLNSMQIPAFLRERVSKDMFGLGMGDLKQLQLMNDKLKEIGKTVDQLTEDELKTLMQEMRAGQDVFGSLKVILDSLSGILKEVFVPVLVKLGELTTWLRTNVAYLFDGMSDGHRLTVSIIASFTLLGIATLLLINRFKILSFALGGLFGDKSSATLKNVGESIKSFIDVFKSIELGTAIKFAFIATVLGLALIGLGYVVRLASADMTPAQAANMLAFSKALVLIGGALALASVAFIGVAIALDVFAPAILPALGILTAAAVIMGVTAWVFSKVASELNTVFGVFLDNIMRFGTGLANIAVIVYGAIGGLVTSIASGIAVVIGSVFSGITQLASAIMLLSSISPTGFIASSAGIATGLSLIAASMLTLIGVGAAATTIDYLAKAVNKVDPSGLLGVASAMRDIADASSLMISANSISLVMDLSGAIGKSKMSIVKASETINIRPKNTAMAISESRDTKACEILTMIHGVLQAIAKKSPTNGDTSIKEAPEIVQTLQNIVALLADSGFSSAPTSGKWNINSAS